MDTRREWEPAVLTALIMKLEHFLPLPEEDREWLNGPVLQSDELPAHSDIIRQGELRPGVFVVIAGHACRYKILPYSSRQILDFMFPGDMAELHSLLVKAFSHGIFTLGATTLAWIDRDRPITEIIDRPLVTAALQWSSLQQSAILRERITAIGRRDAYARIAHLLCEMFERLRSVGETADHNYQLPVTQAELGKQLAGMETRAMDEAFNLRKRAIWYREFAERAGNPWIWEARLRRADELEKEAAHLEKEPSPNRQEAEAA